MEANPDFSQRIVLDTSSLAWLSQSDGNPQGSASCLRSDTGCELFVKRYAFELSMRRERARLDTTSKRWLSGLVAGLSVISLHQHQYEHAALARW